MDSHSAVKNGFIQVYHFFQPNLRAFVIFSLRRPRPPSLVSRHTVSQSIRCKPLEPSPFPLSWRFFKAPPCSGPARRKVGSACHFDRAPLFPRMKGFWLSSQRNCWQFCPIWTSNSLIRTRLPSITTPRYLTGPRLSFMPSDLESCLRWLEFTSLPNQTLDLSRFTPFLWPETSQNQSTVSAIRSASWTSALATIMQSSAKRVDRHARGRQINVSFHKARPSICQSVTKQDQNFETWGSTKKTKVLHYRGGSQYSHWGAT